MNLPTNQQVRAIKKHHSQIPVSLISSQLPLPIRSLHQGLIIAGRFKLLEKIGQGSFGSIFKTENIETGEICATKLEKREDNTEAICLLVREIKVLMEIKGSYGFPQIQFYGRDEHYNYFMANYLGYNFESLMRKCGGKFSVMSTLQLATQIMNRIEVFHSKNLIHRDIKPENFVLGNLDISALYMIDFGLSKYYKDTHQKHIPWVDKKGIIGTARYASINAHLGNEQSRRDDMEAIGYVLVYFAKGKLPWMNINLDSKSDKYNKILEYKQQLSIEQLCENLPQCFLSYFQHIKTLQFTEVPNYSLLKNFFQQTIQEMDRSERFISFDWEKLTEFKGRKGSLSTKNKLDQSPSQLQNKFRSHSKSPKKNLEENHNFADAIKETQDISHNNKNKQKFPISNESIDISPNNIKQKSTPSENVDVTPRNGKKQKFIPPNETIDFNTNNKNLQKSNDNQAKKHSFLMVPIKDENNNKAQRSIADSRNISIDTSRCNNYQMSNLNFLQLIKEETRPSQNFLDPNNGKSDQMRKESRALTISNPKGGAFFRTATTQVVNPQQQQLVVDEDYADFDNIHELAEDEDLYLDVINFETIKRCKDHKITKT